MARAAKKRPRKSSNRRKSAPKAGGSTKVSSEALKCVGNLIRVSQELDDVNIVDKKLRKLRTNTLADVRKHLKRSGEKPDMRVLPAVLRRAQEALKELSRSRSPSSEGFQKAKVKRKRKRAASASGERDRSAVKRARHIARKAARRKTPSLRSSSSARSSSQPRSITRSTQSSRQSRSSRSSRAGRRSQSSRRKSSSSRRKRAPSQDPQRTVTTPQEIRGRQTTQKALLREAARQERIDRMRWRQEQLDNRRREDAAKKERLKRERAERRRRRDTKKDRNRRGQEFYVTGDNRVPQELTLDEVLRKPKKKPRTHPKYKVGDNVAVWSESAKHWFKDGTVAKLGAKNKIHVHYDKTHKLGMSRRWVEEKDQAKFVRFAEQDMGFQIPPPRSSRMRTPCRSPETARIVPQSAPPPGRGNVLVGLNAPAFQPPPGGARPPLSRLTCQNFAEALPKLNIQPAKPKEDYGISDYDSDFTDDSEEEADGFNRKRRIATWARGTALTRAVEKQHALDPERVFGSTRVTCDLSHLFARFPARQKYHDRKESGDWRTDGLGQGVWANEDVHYKVAMGFAG